MTFLIRGFQEADAAETAAMIQRAIHAAGPGHYNAAQIAAWAKRAPNAPALAKRAADGRAAFVAEQGGAVVGYMDVEPDGHIDLLYVDPAAFGAGAAPALLKQIETTNRADRLFVEASEPARRFFAKHGFVETARRDFEIEGVTIHNYAMEKPRAAGAAAA